MCKWVKAFHSLEEVKSIIKKLPNQKTVVYTYGVWDLLHPGHINLLRRAREIGDFLIVGVVADEPVRKLKGGGRPVQNFDDRLSVVGSLRCVDAAIPQTLYDPSDELLFLERIDVLTKGDDWENIPGTETIEAMGGKMVKLGYSRGYSTSQTISKLTGETVTSHGEPI